MKKIVALVFFITSGFLVAQNEVKLDVGDALVMKTLDVSFEHYLTEQTSVGASALFNFEKENADFRYNENTMISSFVRHYFTAENTWNWFGELFISYNSGEKNNTSDYSDGAIGIGFGYKYISAGGFTVDFHVGAGRNLFSEDSPAIVPRAGVNVGFQF